MWQQLKELLPKRLNHLGLAPQVDGATVCRLWEKHASQVFLKTIMENHEAISFRDGVLNLSVANPIFSQEIKHHATRIVSAINQELGKETVKKVLYR